MADDSHWAPLEVAPTRDKPNHTERDDSRPGEACGEVRDPALLDLENMADRLRGMGVRCHLGEDGLWAGKVCLDAWGEISTDGKVRGMGATHLGRGVQDFVELLQRTGAIPKEPPKSAACKGSGKRGFLSPFGPPVSRRLKGKRADKAIERMHAFLEEHKISYTRLSTGRFLIQGRIQFNPPSGRIRLKGGRTHPVRGLIALTKLLAQEANDPELGDLYLRSLRQGDPDMSVTDEPMEKAWAGSIAARALAMAARSRPARGTVAQEG